MCGDEEHVVRYPIGRELERDARATDPRDVCEDLDLVVEPRGREIFDIVGAHHELAAAAPVVQEAETAQVLDARKVEVGVVAPVVDDPLRVRVGESHPRAGGEREGRRRLLHRGGSYAVGPAEPCPGVRHRCRAMRSS